MRIMNIPAANHAIRGYEISVCWLLLEMQYIMTGTDLIFVIFFA